MFRKKKKHIDPFQATPRHWSELEGYVQRLQSNDLTLTKIVLENRRFGAAGAKRLADALAGNTYLTELSLWNIGIGNEGAKVLAEALGRNGSLLKLKLGYDSISWGVKALASELAENGSLQELDLTYNSINNEGAKALAVALKGKRYLQKLCLYRNSIGDEGANALADALLSNNTITDLNLDSNSGITDESLRRKIRSLLEMNKSGPEEAARRKETEYGVIAAVAPSQTSSPFFVKLMEEDARNINVKITELIPLIDDVHQLKIFYTIVASCLRSGATSDSEAASYVKNALEGSSALCSSEDAIVAFKLVLEKASEDGHIPRTDFHRYDNRAEVTRMEHAPFVKSMREAMRANTARIEGLEANVEAVNNSINSIKRGLRRKQKVDATVGFIGAVVNAVSLGVGGSLLAAAEKTLGSIVDFGDVIHMKKVVEESGDSELMEQFQLGVEIGSGRISDDRLEKAIKEDNVLVVLSVAAVMSQQSPGESTKEGGVGNTVVSFDAHDAAYKDEGKEGDGDNVPGIFSDAILDELEEDNLPMHAAIKYGDKECLEEALAEVGVDVNQVDSKGRTAMDLAALTGQLELLELVNDVGGKFKYKNPPRMKHIAKKREAHKEKYFEIINEQA